MADIVRQPDETLREFAARMRAQGIPLVSGPVVKTGLVGYSQTIQRHWYAEDQERMKQHFAMEFNHKVLLPLVHSNRKYSITLSPMWVITNEQQDYIGEIELRQEALILVSDPQQCGIGEYADLERIAGRAAHNFGVVHHTGLRTLYNTGIYVTSNDMRHFQADQVGWKRVQYGYGELANIVQSPYDIGIEDAPAPENGPHDIVLG
jgi:hypothetical protein